ncbi:MAG: hypothetical protein ACRD5M_00475 [Candidatus Acidiferrales bacterium]
MRATIWPHRIDILGANWLPQQAWEPLLNDLKAEHVPSATPVGKRMAVTLGPNGRTDAFVYRTTPIADAKVVRILQKYGIASSIGVENAPSTSETFFKVPFP